MSSGNSDPSDGLGSSGMSANRPSQTPGSSVTYSPFFTAPSW
jgi:hypothetical protein